jgi:hypothetical protein
MANGVYNYFKSGIQTGTFDLDTTGAGAVWVALVNNSYTFSADHNFTGQFIGTYQVSGTGYTAGGVALSSPHVYKDDANAYGAFRGSNVLWSSSTITARGAVLYRSSGAGAASDGLICYVDFGQDYTSSSGTFTIQWNASAIVYLT